jgi:hypothetical protein
MHPARQGSAAATRNVVPESAVNVVCSTPATAGLRAAIDRCIEGIDTALALARSAKESAEPARAALLIAGVLDDLGPELKVIRAAARRHLSTP